MGRRLARRELVVRIDPDTRAVTDTIRVGRSPAGVAVGAGSVWVANSGDGTVTRINPTTDKPATITVGGSPQALTVADGRVWVTVDQRSIAPTIGSGGGTLHVVSFDDVDSMDPGAGLRRGLVATPVRDLRAALELPRRGRSRRVTAQAGGRPGVTDTLRRRQDVHVHGASGLPVLATRRISRSLRRRSRPRSSAP